MFDAYCETGRVALTLLILGESFLAISVRSLPERDVKKTCAP